MVKNLRVHAANLRAVSRLTIAGIAGLVDLVEAMHHNIAIVPLSRTEVYALIKRWLAVSA